MSQSGSREEVIFHAIMDLTTPQERVRYLERACGDDRGLRQRVEALLRAAKEPEDFLEQPVVESMRSAMEASASEAGGSQALAGITEKPGDRIGPYKLLERIGEGGCGVVYMAEQEDPIRRRVALKVVKLGMDTRDVIARFEAERQALALMDHQNIARVYDAGSTTTGRPYFVMELVRGININDYCDQNELPALARLDLFMQVCHAIQHAHQKGVIHRDIKPSNILVTLHDGVPVPKVIDFGIAKATGQQRLTDKTVFTAFRQFIGTPAYMSPEQAEMSGLDIDTRSDIYSLGVLLYELLTGWTPFPEKELLAAGLDEMRRTIREQQPPKPSTRLSTMLEADRTTVAKRRQIDPAKLIHLLRGDLDWIVMKCLEKDRARRYATANGLAADLQRHLNHEPVVARPPSRMYSFSKMVSRNKVAFTAVGAVAASLLLGLGLSTWLLVQERAARAAARLEADRSHDVQDLLKELLNGVTPAVAKGREVVLLRYILDKTAERVNQRLAKAPEVMADIQTAIGQVYSSVGEYPRAEGILHQAVATRRRVVPNSLELAESLDSLSLPVWKQGRLREAEQAEREALALRVTLLTTNSQETATSLNNLGVVLNEQDKLEQAQAALESALAIQQGLPSKDEARIAETLTALSSTAWKKRQYDKAEALDREALALYRGLWDDLHPDVALALNNLGTVLNDEGKFTEAIAIYRQAREIQKKLFPHEHDDMATTLHNLAKALWNNGALKEAEEIYRELLVIWPKIHGPDCREYAVTLNNLGTVLANQERLTEAETLHQQALDIQHRLHFDADLPGSLNNLAAVYLRQKRPSEAEPLFGEAIVLLRQRGKQPTDLATCFRSHTVVLRDLGRLEEAEQAARDCRSLCETEPSLRDDWRKFDAMSLLGGILVLRTNYDEAEPLLLKGNLGLLERAAAVPADNKIRLNQTFERLVKLYEARGAPDQAAAWKQKLAEFETAQGEKASPAK